MTTGYVSPAEKLFPVHVATIEQLVESGIERVERERAKLTRPDGAPMYAPQEHAERVQAIEEEAAAAYDRSTQRFLTLADDEQQKAERELAKLEGFDPWERLSEAERQVAATRREFVKEDAEGGRPDQIVKQARAALAANDKPAIYLWGRYLRKRVEGGDTGHGGELAGVLRDLEDVFGDASERHQQRRDLENRIEAAKSLRGRVSMGRSRVNGSEARALEAMRRNMMARW